MNFRTFIRRLSCAATGHGVWTPVRFDHTNGRVRIAVERCASCGACRAALRGVPNRSGRVGRNQSTRRRVK